ncbi:hypothetical protein HN51_014965 [Arachis hypogaea]|uniref:translocator protein homolog n=1 Tax=Arachis hypogaea TaxID=3818 RepID=UPI000DEC9A7D|nr:translocator protein homolog [Arachis hypogaea]
MASQELKHRVTHDADTKAGGGTTTTTRRDKKMAMAKRGLRSLLIAVILPLSLTLFSAYISSSMSRANHHMDHKTPFWFPPSWALHLTLPASGFLMGLSAWMVWAEGGFHKHPVAVVLYVAQLLLTVLWDPLVFGAGASRVGMVLCLGLFGCLYGCMRVFKQVNHVAADLIKPCLAWTAFLSIVNLKLLSA